MIRENSNHCYSRIYQRFFDYLTHVHGDTEPRTDIYKHVEIDGNIFDDSQLNESQ